jgi:hypothetical protein
VSREDEVDVREEAEPGVEGDPVQDEGEGGFEEMGLLSYELLQLP